MVLPVAGFYRGPRRLPLKDLVSFLRVFYMDYNLSDSFCFFWGLRRKQGESISSTSFAVLPNWDQGEAALPLVRLLLLSPAWCDTGSFPNSTRLLE